LPFPQPEIKRTLQGHYALQCEQDRTALTGAFKRILDAYWKPKKALHDCYRLDILLQLLLTQAKLQ
jgi:hypothetical protein